MREPTPGDLIQIIEMPDQGYYEKSLRGKLGVIIEHVHTNSSPNIWKILIDNKCCNLHLFDFVIVQSTKKE